LEVDTVARREYQNPSILERKGANGPEWYIRYRVRVLEMVDGKPVVTRREKWYVLGLQKEMTKRKAERKRDEIMREVNGQIYTIQSHIPFVDFLAVYKAEHYRGLKETSKRFYDFRIKAWIEPMFADKKLYQIGPLDVAQMLGAMERASVARNTRVATRAIVANIFKMAKRWGYLKDADNPAKDAEIGRDSGAARTIWTPTLEEARAIIAQADAELALILEMIVWTGMRISEVVGLRCANVDVLQAVAYVRERNVRHVMDDPKSKAGQRALPLGYLAPRLAPLMGAPQDFIFRQPDGESYTDQLLYRRVRAAMQAANLYHEGNAFHAFRRLHSTLMSQRLSLFDLRAQMGHADIKTTQKYVAANLDNRRDALRDAQAEKVISIRKKA
jgi:integrase